MQVLSFTKAVGECRAPEGDAVLLHTCERMFMKP